MSKVKFKIGDKVRAIRRKDGFFNRAWLTEGQVYTVERADNNTVVVYSDKYAMTGGFKHEDFEPVESNESELERLVRVANEGNEAQRRLRLEFPEQYEVRFEYQDWQSGGTQPRVRYCIGYRIKQKPAFEPFTVGSGWQVKLEGETLHIGCRQFEVKAFKRCLKQVCGGYNQSDFGPEMLKSTRNGVMYGGYEISWADADKLLAALDKAGI